MGIDRALNTEGWIAREELEYLAQRASRSLRIAEIGSWKGRSTIALAENTPGHVWAIDTFEGSQEQGEFDKDSILSDFKKNTEGLPISTVQMKSLDAAKMFADKEERFDLIFIDAAHDYENVKADILAWRPLLAPNGIICGHDYHEAWDGVRKAVDELIPKFRVVWTIWTTEEVC